MTPPYPKVLVCWSGGCDSTLLLHHTARIYGTSQTPVRALAISASQVTSRKKEASARKRLLREFKRRHLHIELTELELTTIQGDGLKHHGLPQAIVWLLASQALKRQETLSLGYIRGDDWPQDVEAFRSIFDALQKIADRKGTLWLPLIRTEKRGVLHQLQELKLLHLTWWCEVPRSHKGKNPCGECRSCQTHETALWKLERFGPPKHYWHGNRDGS